MRRLLLFSGNVIDKIVNTFKARVLADSGMFEGESYLKTFIASLKNLGIYNLASLIITPNAYKTSKWYAFLGTDTTFTRNSTANINNSLGVIEARGIHVPLLDYGLSANPCLMLEPSMTNYIKNSSDLTQSNWIKFAATIGSNVITAPDGTATMDKVVATNSASTYRGVCQGTNVVGLSTTIVYSGYFSAGEYTKIHFGDQSAGRINVAFNLATGVLISSAGAGYISSSIVLIPNTTIYRISIKCSTDSTTNHISPIVTGYPNTGATLNTFGCQYAGDGTSGLYMWGQQLTIGDFITSYIPTGAATVTKVADVYSLSSISAMAVGTVFIHLINNIPLSCAGTHTYGVLNLAVGTGYPGIAGLSISRSNNTRAKIWNRVLGSILYATTADDCKLAITFDGTYANVWQNGTKVVSNLAFTGSGFTDLFTSASLETPYYIQDGIVLVPSILSDSICVTLTT